MKITIGNWRKYAKVVDKESTCPLDPEFYRDQLKWLAAELQQPDKALNLGGYAYRPGGGQSWIATDGSRIIATLVDLILEWGEQWIINELEGADDCDYLRQSLIVEVTDQQGHEAARLRGNRN